MMNVTCDIARDLLPLYAAGECSADTRAAVEAWLPSNSDLARELKALQASIDLPDVGPSPSGERQALERTRALLRRRTWTLAFAVLCSSLPFSIVGGSGGIRFVMLRDAPGVAVALLVAAGLFWGAYGVTVRRLRVSGL